VPLLKPIGQMVKQKEDDDDLVYTRWLTQIVYYHMSVLKALRERYELRRQPLPFGLWSEPSAIDHGL
jgi:hypothetical protein